MQVRILWAAKAAGLDFRLLRVGLAAAQAETPTARLAGRLAPTTGPGAALFGLTDPVTDRLAGIARCCRYGRFYRVGWAALEGAKAQL